MKPGTRRVVRHVSLAGGSLLSCVSVGAFVGWENSTRALSMSTAYVGLGLLAATLVLGPINLLLGRANPVSTHLRRDVGIWAGLLSLAHVIVGFQRHMGGQWKAYFFFPEGGPLTGARFDPFGLANWTGLGATLIVAVLIVLSNDLSLRRLGAQRWKWIQRWNYLVFSTVVLHGLIYQATTNRPVPWIAAVLVVTVGVLAAQLLGVLRFRFESA